MLFFGRKKKNVSNFLEENEQINLSRILKEKNKQEIEETQAAEIAAKSNRQSVEELLASAEKNKITPVHGNKHIKNFEEKINMQEKVTEFYQKDRKNQKRPLTKEEKREIIQRRRYMMNLEKNAYAGFFSRLLAFIIDSLIVLSIIQFIPQEFKTEYDFVFKTISVFIFVYIIYSLLTNLILKGQSLGKAIMGIKVVKDSTEDIDIFTIIFRETVGKLFMLKLPILGIFIIFSKKRHHLMDYLIGTSVLRIKYIEDYRVLMTINA